MKEDGMEIVLGTNTPTDVEIYEAGYLVSRGVRPLAVVATILDDPEQASELWSRLASSTFGASVAVTPIPFVVRVVVFGTTMVHGGYAARKWLIETWQWVHEIVPASHRNRLTGLLLGYSVEAIAAFDESESGIPPENRRATPSPAPAVDRGGSAR